MITKEEVNNATDDQLLGILESYVLTIEDEDQLLNFLCIVEDVMDKSLKAVPREEKFFEAYIELSDVRMKMLKEFTVNVLMLKEFTGNVSKKKTIFVCGTNLYNHVEKFWNVGVKHKELFKDTKIFYRY
jgi:hypothetical protein